VVLVALEGAERQAGKAAERLANRAVLLAEQILSVMRVRQTWRSSEPFRVEIVVDFAAASKRGGGPAPLPPTFSIPVSRGSG
jgi:hypothetical protein